nr:hypothetical protein BaRGS_023325 [Batillaria attramentaria]
MKEFDDAVNDLARPTIDAVLAMFPFLRFVPGTRYRYLTSLQTLKALFLCLAHNPEVTRKLQKEIDVVIGNRPVDSLLQN